MRFQQQEESPRSWGWGTFTAVFLLSLLLGVLVLGPSQRWQVPSSGQTHGLHRRGAMNMECLPRKCPPPPTCPAEKQCPECPAAVQQQAAQQCPECPAQQNCPEPAPQQCPDCPAQQECPEPTPQLCPECPAQQKCPDCPPAPACPQPTPASAMGGAAAELTGLRSMPYAGLVSTAAAEGKEHKYKESALEFLAKYELKLPQRAAQRGLFSIGEPARMRRFVHKLLSGQRVSVAAMGGSVTAGQGAIYLNGYVKHFYEFLNQTSGPEVPNDLKNAAFGGSTSSLFSACVNTVVQQDVDMVLVEFALNDPMESGMGDAWMNTPSRRAFERLLRKLLDLPNRPAVVMLNYYAWFVARTNKADYKSAKFYRSAENEFTVMGQYYSLPILSMRAAMYRHMKNNEKGYQVTTWRREHETSTNEPDLFYYDEVHPQDAMLGTGHRLVSDMLVTLVRSTASDLLLRPLSPLDEEIAKEPLQEPMLEGNYQRKVPSCMIQREMEKAVIQQQGFVFKNERPNALVIAGEKWGWIGDTPGSWAVIEIDSRTEGKDDSKDNNQVVLAYLKSYEKMGKARIECVANCMCQPSQIDGHWQDKASLSDLHRIDVSPHEKCHIKATVLNETSSGQHKVKLMGIMLSSGTLHEAMGVQVDIIGTKSD